MYVFKPHNPDGDLKGICALNNIAIDISDKTLEIYSFGEDKIKKTSDDITFIKITK